MADTLNVMSPMGEESILDYPPDRLYVPWGAIAAVGLHLFLVGTFLLLAYLNHIRSLRDLMTASIPQIPLDQFQILLIDDNKPPPPTNHPLWIKQLIIPKVKPPPPPPPPPKPKPKPKPQVVRLAPPPRLVMGSHHLPTPSYPIEAYRERIEGTVLIRVSFDGSGGVINAEVVGSSGSDILDGETRHFILENWRETDMAGQVQVVPIQFKMPH